MDEEYQERVIRTETLLEAHLASCSEESRKVRERMDKLADDIKTDVREIHRRLNAASRTGGYHHAELYRDVVVFVVSAYCRLIKWVVVWDKSEIAGVK